MPPKKTTRRRRAREPTWDEIGKAVGSKFEKYEQDECFPMKKKSFWFHHHEHGGGFGRLLFIIGVLLAMNALGMLAGIPWYATLLILVGFWWMKF